MTADSDWKSAPIFKRKYGSQIWNFIAVESNIFVCESSSSSTGDSSLVENGKNICPQLKLCAETKGVDYSLNRKKKAQLIDGKLESLR